MTINRSNVHRLLLVISLVVAAIGFSDAFGPQISGLGRGFGAVSFSLFLIFNYLKNEKTDQELAMQPEQRKTTIARAPHVSNLRPVKA